MRHAADGDEIHWAIATAASAGYGSSGEQVAVETAQIDRVAAAFGFKSTQRLNLQPSFLDRLPLSDIIDRLKAVIERIQPDVVYMPHDGDAHSDHGVVARAVVASTKWFRASSIRRLLAYETLSETEFGLAAPGGRFAPNVFVDITKFLDRKLEILAHYETEIGAFPFPRSDTALRALAALRGSTSGFDAAEAFMLLKETA